MYDKVYGFEFPSLCALFRSTIIVSVLSSETSEFWLLKFEWDLTGSDVMERDNYRM